MPDTVRRQARAASAWNRIVKLAVTERLDAVLLSGDVVDESNRFWEAIGPLEAGVNQLAAAHIPVLAVAGNHDHAVLARLADQFPRDRFALLGRGGSWERFTLQQDGRPWLHVDGWSFPRENVQVSPLNSYALPADPGVPTLGLVHGDLGVAGSPYAPLDLGQLQALPPRAWLLGHVHAPRLEAPPDRPWVLMPGSPQALDPGEPGPHGPWLASVEGSRIGTPVQQPLSAVWYDELAIDAGPAADETALETLILDALRQRADVISRQAGEDLHYIGARLRLTGASPLADRVYAIAERLRQDLRIASRNSVLGVDTIACDVTPRLDLAEQARMPTLPGGIARLLQELDRPEAPSAGVADLLRSARQAIEQAENSKEFALFERRPLDDNRLRELLRLQAHALLTQLARPPA